MTVVSSKEFATKPTKYYNLAQNEQVVIKRGKNFFYLTCNKLIVDKDSVLEKFIETRPKNIDLSDDEIMEEIRAIRYTK